MRFALTGILCLTALLTACAEAGPTQPSLASAPRQSLQRGPDAPPLLADSVSFTALQGESSTLTVYYDNPRTAEPDEGDWFLKLEIPADAQFVDAQGNPRSDGDSVVLTAVVDSEVYVAHLEPHGSQFPGAPAVLAFNYKYGDLRGREARDLRVWYRATNDDPWSPQPTNVDVSGHWIFAELTHFSNFAVAW